MDVTAVAGVRPTSLKVSPSELSISVCWQNWTRLYVENIVLAIRHTHIYKGIGGYLRANRVVFSSLFKEVSVPQTARLDIFTYLSLIFAQCRLRSLNLAVSLRSTVILLD